MTQGLNTDPIALAERRLSWLEQRQQVLARNVANADTPGYRAQDVTAFARVLAQGSGSPAASLLRTNPNHLASKAGDSPLVTDRQAAERSADGNTVALDQQALKVSETSTAQALALGLRSKYLALYRAALGRGA